MAKDDRLRVPIDDPYLHALGLALFCFASLEWNAVYVAQRISANGHNRSASPDYLKRAKGRTAGDIGKDLVKYAQGIADAAIREQVIAAAETFKLLVERRNALMHANPATAPNGDQRLFRNSDQWTIEAVSDLADDLTNCSLQFNHLIHHVL
ncbi:hypothetical protein QBK93_34745 [Rhizobium leguminosarum]|uniref:hypothetical protein n=1 Tax=Rhizobium leguminosarum TaxID=384 RepID=UPI0024A96E29|nr:hypothetical protein [Rhizobium leguminosarum]MDI5929768.1 hypothetical protein [Rhizobium leguminosarum]